MSDIFAVEEVVAMDFLYLLIYFGLCLGDVFASSDTHHHASAIGFQYAVIVLGSHMEYRAIKQLYAFNDCTFRIIAWVAFRGKYNANGGFLAPAHRLIAF